MAGIAAGQVIAYSGCAMFLFWYLNSNRARVPLDFSTARLRWNDFRDILRVGALACVSPVQSILTALILTRLVSSYGTETLAGFGIGARLEFLLIPVAFGVGVTCVSMVGIAIGAGDVDRARRVAWTGGFYAGALVGVIGLIVAIWPDHWSTLFTNDRGVLSAASAYFTWAAPTYALYGIGLCLFFASQGAGKMLWPVLAGSVRFAVIAVGGWWLHSSRLSSSEFECDFAEVAAARLEPEGVGDPGEREAPIDDRSNADDVETAHHVLLMPTATDDQSLQALLADDGARG
jgi:Na+-driven multidrug efflux pump